MFSRPTNRWRQKGVISILSAFSLGVALVIAALALDLGRIYWIKRDLQKVADLASLSAVTDLSSEAAARKIAEDIAKANGFDPAGAGNSLTVNTGIYDWTGRAYAQGGAIDMRNAVHVTAATTVPYYFQPGSLRVEAKAVSARDAYAGFSLGSFIARLDTTQSALLNSVLGGLLGGAINLDIGSYKGLAAGTVTLAGLQAALGIGTVDELLNANVSLPGLLDATITALTQKGDAASLNAAGILGPIQAAAAADRTLRLGDLLTVDTANKQAAANIEVNVMQLLQLSAEVANGSHFIDIPNLGVSVPGIANVGLALSVIEPPSMAMGPARCKTSGSCSNTNVNDWVTTAHTAQIRLKLGLNLLGGVINLPIYLEAGAADAALTKIVCRSPINDSEVTILANPQLLHVYIGNVDPAVMQDRTKTVTVTRATLVNLLGLITITGLVDAPVGGGSARDLVFNGPFDQNNNKSTASLGIGSTLNAAAHQPGSLIVNILGIGIELGPILDALFGILGAVLDSLLDPLLSLLGVSLGGADVTVSYLNCGVPQLVR